MPTQDVMLLNTRKYQTAEYYVVKKKLCEIKKIKHGMILRKQDNIFDDDDHFCNCKINLNRNSQKRNID